LREEMPLDRPFAPLDGEGEPLGLRVDAFVVPGKVPLYAEAGNEPALAEDGEALGVSIPLAARRCTTSPAAP
jgi:pyrroloquinoline quinone biosynthesis protein B